MSKKILILQVILLIAMPGYLLAAEPLPASGQAIETIVYEISPLGVSVYQDLGLVDFRGRKANLVIFSTQVAGFKDTEKIYSEPDTYLPLSVERDLYIWFHKEYLVEEYSSKENKLNITKFEGGKKTAEYFYQVKGPIHNAILLPFFLRQVPDLRIGWTYDIRLPEEFRVKLVSIEDIAVPAGRYKAYHFTSIPPKFEVWISTDSLRLPVKIKGLSGIPYALAMQKHTLKK
jgi:hypothetical protein